MCDSRQPLNGADSEPHVRSLTIDQAKALPGMLGRLATAMLTRNGEYAYTEAETGQKVLLVLEAVD